MDKLLLSLYFTILLTTLTVNSAPMPSSKIISAIEQQQQQQMRQKKYGHVINNDNNNNDNNDGNNENDDSIKTENAESNSQMQKANKNADRMAEYMGDDVEDVDDDDDDRRPSSVYDRRDEIIGEMRQHRQNKMFGYFSFNPFAYTAPPYTQSLYYPPEFFDDFASYYGFNSDEEEIMSRQNPGNRRRPGTGNFKNSPIYYIRLPPTPYMFVPGLGYISQPPTYTPMAPPPQTISPFYNLPLDFISNGKPTNIYQWGSPAAQFAQQPQFTQQPQFAPQPQFVPQTPAYQPSYQRPQRPYQRPMNPYVQESKVTNLKGAFLFNGRPEEIYVLPPSSYNSIYPDPRFVSPYY